MSVFVPDVPVTPDSGRWKPVVRGFGEGVEVLGEFGWVSLGSFLGSDVLGGLVPFRGNGYRVGGFGVGDSVFGQWRVGGCFPRLASVDPVSGGVVFVRPSLFQWFDYDGWLVSVKGRGVDFVCSLFTDLWVHPRYGRGFKFVPAGDVVRNRNGRYGLLNKFGVDLYGDFVPRVDPVERVVGSGLGGEPVVGLGSGLSVELGRPFVLEPGKHVKRVRVWDKYGFERVWDDVLGREVKVDRVRDSVGVFNVVLPPFHNFVVRWGRVNDNPRTPWVGGPVVVGDGLDKSLLRVDGVLRGGGSLGGSYSVLGGV